MTDFVTTFSVMMIGGESLSQLTGKIRKSAVDQRRSLRGTKPPEVANPQEPFSANTLKKRSVSMIQPLPRMVPNRGTLAYFRQLKEDAGNVVRGKGGEGPVKFMAHFESVF
jgi:hypothetical protein